MNEETEGKVITFYSFKGGVGRTMALANVAWILASRGYKVLMVDWDLDSPGLHRYFKPFLDQVQIEATPGVIELISDYVWAAMRQEPRREDWHRPYAEILTHAISVNWQFPPGAALDFLSAGQQDRNYSRTLAELDWDNFFERLGGGSYLEALRDSMKRHYDYALIDSRTGLCDLSEVCALHLPDVLVEGFTLNDQSIEGAADVANNIDKNYHHRDIRVLPVPMRIDDAEQEKLEAGRSLARARFAGFPQGMTPEQADAYWSAVEIPYRPFYGYEEILTPFGDPPGSPLSLLSAYERLATQIVGEKIELPRMADATRLQFRDVYTRRRVLPPSDIYLSYVVEDRAWAEWVAAVLAKSGFRVLKAADSEPAGSNEREAAARSATAANRTVVLLSDAYLRSQQQLGVREGIAAIDPAGVSRRLIPVRVRPSRLPEPFQERTVVDLTYRDAAEAAREILRALDRPPQPGDQEGDWLPSEPRHPRALPPVWNVPARNASFTGRSEELDRLRGELFGENSETVRPQALYGYGGVGKTALALEYAHLHMAEYDLVWWVPSAQPGLINSSFAELASRLELPIGNNIAGAGKAALEALRLGHPHSRWLLIFDNATDPADLEEYLPPGAGHVLVTSRNPAWSRLAHPVEVDVFQRRESLDHLKRRVPRLTDADAVLVAEELGDLPIAVEQAAAWLRETGMSPAEYVEGLSASAAVVLDLNTPENYPVPVAATWLLAFERLREESPAAARLLQVCACFAPEPIAPPLLYNQQMISVLKSIDPRIRDQRMIGQLTREIARYSLARVDPRGYGIQVHRLIQDVIRASMQTEEELDAAMHAAHEVLVGSRPEDGSIDDPHNWPRYELIWPHLGPSRAAECGDDATRQLLIDRIRYLWRRGSLAEALESASRLAAQWEQRYGQNDAQTLYLRFHIANVLRSQGEYGAAQVEDTAVLASQRATRAIGERHVHTLLTAGSLAGDLRGLGQFDQALEMDRQTRDRFQEYFGDNDPGTLSAANNLAIDLRLTGDFRAAHALDTRTLRARETVHGPDHPNTLHSAAMVARDMREAGDYAGSIELLRETHLRYAQHLGDNDLGTLSTLKSLAVSLRKAGQLTEARQLTEDVRQRYRQGHAGVHPEVLSCEVNLACDQAALGDSDGALRTARQVYREYARIFGSGHPFTLAVAANMAGYLRGTGDAEAAQDLAERTLDALREAVGDDHPYSLACALTAANCRYDLGQVGEAESLVRDTIDRCQRTLGEQHPDTLVAQANLAVLRWAQGQADEAAQRRRQILSALSRQHGLPEDDGHPSLTALRGWALQDGDLEIQPT